MIKQMKTRPVTLGTVMRSKPFVEGFQSVRKGKPLEYERYGADTRAQWNYERGRLLALEFDGTLKSGREVNYGAMVVYWQSLCSGAIL